MSDLQGTLKDMIFKAQAQPKPWEVRAQPLRLSSSNRPRKNIRPKHKMIVAMHMAGFDNREIAHEFGYRSENAISAILRSNHPELQEVRRTIGDMVADKTGDLILGFQTEARSSLKKLVEIRDDLQAPRSEQRLSALAILDRAGYTPLKKSINFDTNIPLNELKGVVGAIENANSILDNRERWVVKNLPTGTEG